MTMPGYGFTDQGIDQARYLCGGFHQESPDMSDVTRMVKILGRAGKLANRRRWSKALGARSSVQRGMKVVVDSTLSSPLPVRGR